MAAHRISKGLLVAAVYLALTATVGGCFYVGLRGAAGPGVDGGVGTLGISAVLAGICVAFTAWSIRGRLT
jgi:hypothetical protein